MANLLQESYEAEIKPREDKAGELQTRLRDLLKVREEKARSAAERLEVFTFELKQARATGKDRVAEQKEIEIQRIKEEEGRKSIEALRDEIKVLEAEILPTAKKILDECFPLIRAECHKKLQEAVDCLDEA